MKPILGILSEWQGEERADRPFGAQTALFEAILTAAADSPAEAFVIVPQSLPSAEAGGMLKAYAFSEGAWSETNCPFPSVVYNRLPSRRAEEAPEGRALYRALEAFAKGRVFNRSGFFSKFRIYSVLRKRPLPGLRIPITQTVNNPEQVLRAANQWGRVWVKPDAGSLGRGVSRIIKEPYGYTLEIGDHASAEHVEESEARVRVAELLKERASWIMQQDIDLARHEGRPFDIRVLLHKDESNQFKVTHRFARLAEHGQIVSNLTAGGEALSLRQLLTNKEIATLKRISMAAANRLDAALRGPIGELGLDLALDQNRQFWLIEANSKPFLKMDAADPLTQTIAKRIVDYACHLIENPQMSKPKPRPPARSNTKTVGRTGKPALRRSLKLR